MDIVNLLRSAVKQFDEAGCGLCFTLVLGGRKDFFNNEKNPAPLNPQEDCDCDLCCVRVGMFQCKSRDGFESSNYGSFLKYRDWDLVIFMGIPSRLDIQFFDEVDIEKENESKWAKNLHPLKCCIDGMQLNLCKIYDSCKPCNENHLEVIAWSVDMKIDYLDKNFDGWMITTTIREWLS